MRVPNGILAGRGEASGENELFSSPHRFIDPDNLRAYPFVSRMPIQTVGIPVPIAPGSRIRRGRSIASFAFTGLVGAYNFGGTDASEANQGLCLPCPGLPLRRR